MTTLMLRCPLPAAASHWFGDVMNTSAAGFSLDLKVQEKSFNVEGDLKLLRVCFMTLLIIS